MTYILFQVGIVSFIPLDESENSNGKLFDPKHKRLVPFSIREETELRNISVNATSSMLRLTRGGQTLKEVIQDAGTTFDLSHPTYSPVAWAKRLDETAGNAELRPIVIQVRICGKINELRISFLNLFRTMGSSMAYVASYSEGASVTG